MEYWTPENREEEPRAMLTLPGGEFEATRTSARLYTHLGKLAIYDHIYCAQVEDEEVKQSFYIFNFIDGYQELKDYMVENNFPAFINQTQINSTDVEAYERAVLRDIDITPDWLPEA